MQECQICKSINIKHYWSYSDYKILKCRRCLFEFSFPYKAGNEEYYENFETYNESALNDIKSGNIHPGNYVIANDIEKVLLSRGLKIDKLRMLDVGSGVGWYANFFKLKGANILAIDFNQRIVKFSKEYFNLNAKHMTVMTFEKDTQIFDVIYLIHVLEHVENPDHLIKMLYEKISNNGEIVICVPNPNYIRDKKKFRQGLMGKNYYPPHHINFWCEKSLYKLLDICKFNNILIYSQNYPTYTQSSEFLKKLGIRNNKINSFLSKIIEKIGILFKISGANIYAYGKK